MGEFYFKQPDELYHYGIKGMKWGVRHDPERSGNGRGSSGSSKKMSTAKKVAIGAAAVAAVAGVSYVAVKAHKKSVYNKAAQAAIQRALSSGHRTNGKMKVTRGLKDARMVKNVPGTSIPVPNPNYGKARSLTGHSNRRTRAGAAQYRGGFYSKKAANTKLSYDYMTNATNKRRQYEAKANDAWQEMGDITRNKIINGQTPRYYKYDSVNKLRRKKR